MTGNRGLGQWCRDRKVSTKVLAVAGVAIAGTVATGTLSIVGIADLQSARNQEIAVVLPYGTNLNDAALVAKAAANDERGYLIQGDESFAEETLKRKTKVDADLAAARALAADAAAEARIDAIKAATDAWFAALESEFELYETKPEAATELALGENRDLRKAYEELLTAEIAYADEALLKGQEFDREVAETRTWVFVTLGVALVLAVTGALLVSRMIVRPLHRVGKVLDEVADGDLSGEADVHQRDELGHMADSLRRATGTLRQTVTDLTAHSQSLASQAGSLAETSKQSATSAEQGARQAATVSESAATMSYNIQTVAAGSEEMGASIREISESATRPCRWRRGRWTSPPTPAR